MKKIALYIIAFVFFQACTQSNKPTYVSIPFNTFNVQNESLENKQLVQVISFSGMPDDNPNMDYYIHMIVVCKATNDTFNLLSVGTFEFQDNPNNEKHFIAQNSMEYGLFMDPLYKAKGISQPAKIDKVIVDKEFENNTKNNYPTVIGALGTIK